MKHECARCSKTVEDEDYDPETTLCLSCADRMNRNALAFVAAQRDKERLQAEKKQRARADEEARLAARVLAPPREYPHPWRKDKP